MGAPALRQSEPALALPALSQRVDWLSLGFSVPASWELIRHSTNPERGTLAFVDRRRERLRVSWTACAKPPDLSRLIADFSRAEGIRDASPIWRRNDGAHGFSCAAGERQLARAVRYDAAQRRLVELELSARSASRASALLHAVLDSTSPAESPFAVSAFGVSLAGPAEMSLSAADIRPMSARLELTCAHASGSPARLSLERLGAADSWFIGDLAALLARRERSADYRRLTPIAIAGHEALSAHGQQRGPLLPRVLGRLPALEANLWLCPLENAVYILAAASRGRAPFELASVRVRCCRPPLAPAEEANDD